MPDIASSTSPAVSAMVLPSGVVTVFDILTVATPVRQAVRSAASALSSSMPPRACWMACMYRETSTE